MTLFPEIFHSYMNESIMKKAVEKNIIEVNIYNIRDFSTNNHKKVDDYPFGGGAGMVMTPQPIYDTYKHIIEKHDIKNPRVVYLTPKGKVHNQSIAQDFSKLDDVIFLCGHYEGIDERVLEEIVTDYVSIGDYVLTGGELPAMVMVDAISRMVPGVLTNDESGSTESFEGNLLEYPQYSRPEEWMGKKVPSILLSGDHKKVDEWRREQAILRTIKRRPDLLKKAELTKKEQMKYQEYL